MILSAARTYHARKARTRLNLAAGHLEGAVHELEQAGMTKLHDAAESALVDLYEVLQKLPMTNTTERTCP